MELVIDRTQRETRVDLSVRGRLDAESAGELRLAVGEEVRRGWHAIALDLSGVSFLSSAGIRVLFETKREAERAGGECIITAASEPVRKVLVLTRLDTILMRLAAGSGPPEKMAALVAPSREVEAGSVRLVGLDAKSGSPLRVRLIGSMAAITTGDVHPSERLRLDGTSFAIGIAAVPGEAATPESAGESLAACGAVFHRPPRPFAMVDYVLPTGDLVPELDMITGLVWNGMPHGRSSFEPVGEMPSIGIDALAVALLDQMGPGPLAVVIVGEVHGLVAAELIKPLAEATVTDHPLVGRREVAARWLSFSREPIHAGRTAMVVGIISRDHATLPAGTLAPLGQPGVLGHLHAVVFPHRPIRRDADALAAVVDDLTASEPIAVVHLLADDRPVLGDGVSQLVRGTCWFAPLEFPEGAS